MAKVQKNTTIWINVVNQFLNSTTYRWLVYKVRKKAKIRNRCNQVPHLTQDATFESDDTTRAHHIRESKEVSLYTAGDHKAAINRKDSMTDTKNKYQNGSTKKHRVGTVCKNIFTGGLKLVLWCKLHPYF